MAKVRVLVPGMVPQLEAASGDVVDVTEAEAKAMVEAGAGEAVKAAAPKPAAPKKAPAKKAAK